MFCNFVFMLFIILYDGCKASENDGVRKFPDGFIFGSATSAYQIEGAWNEDGKSENIWDHLVHSNPSPVVDNSTGDVAANSYHLHKRDVEMMRELGLDFYRFSLSWARLMPDSFPNRINQAAVDYYNNLINEMLKYNIEPVVTIFHWDLPQKLQVLGGWPNPNIVTWYSDYARVAFELFGDRVKYWITINEPSLICDFGYGIGHMAPRLNYSGVADYMCAKNLLLAHATAYHIYDQEFRPKYGGTIFISLVGQWYEPESDEQIEAAEDSFQFYTAQYSHPIYSKSGGWPPAMDKRVAAKSAEQGYPRSRLPSFTLHEIEFVRGTSDVFGLNHYSSYIVYRNESSMDNFATPSLRNDLGAGRYQRDEWTLRQGEFVTTVPRGFYKVLIKIKDEYDNPVVFVTENGFATHTGIDDVGRVAYHRLYLDALLDALGAGANVRAYTAWSLLDNFEWIQGYTERFGLYEVDFEDKNRTRTPRKFAFVYKEIVRTRALDPHYEPDTTHMTIDEGHC